MLKDITQMSWQKRLQQRDDPVIDWDEEEVFLSYNDMQDEGELAEQAKPPSTWPVKMWAISLTALLILLAMMV